MTAEGNGALAPGEQLTVPREMTSPDSLPSVALPERAASPLAGLLSYLVPGLGQIYQGRVVKGLLFFVCLYGMFFFGMYLGDWRNVYIQPLNTPGGQAGRVRVLDVLIDRARPLGQVWIGVAAWPAIIQYLQYDAEDKEGHPTLGKFQRMPPEAEQNVVLQNSDKTPDLGWMYTVIAGVLNILVIYDAYAGPAFGAVHPKKPEGAGTEEAAK
jgi:hypothetical protein